MIRKDFEIDNRDPDTTELQFLDENGEYTGEHLVLSFEDALDILMSFIENINIHDKTEDYNGSEEYRLLVRKTMDRLTMDCLTKK